MAVTYTIDINAPPELVFDLLDNPDNMKLWMDGLEETIFPAGHEWAHSVGTTFKQRIREGGRVTEYDGKVTAYDKPNQLGVTIGNKQFSVQVDYHLTSNPPGTRLNYRADIVYSTWVARTMGVVFNWFTRRILDRQMKKLKAAAEARAIA